MPPEFLAFFDSFERIRHYIANVFYFYFFNGRIVMVRMVLKSLIGLGMLVLVGCGTSTTVFDAPENIDTARLKTMAGSWVRQDNGIILVLGEDGTVKQESCVLDSAQFIPCDGESHTITTSSVDIKYQIDPYHIWVDTDGNVVMESHYNSIKISSNSQSGDIGGSGKMLSDTKMQITINFNGVSQTLTFVKK
jgi:hypothetical protein